MEPTTVQGTKVNCILNYYFPKVNTLTFFLCLGVPMPRKYGDLILAISQQS